MKSEDIPSLSSEDDARINAERFAKLYEEEVQRCKTININKDSDNKVKPSLAKVAWRFGKTRFIVALVLVMLSMVFQFLGPVSSFD